MVIHLIAPKNKDKWSSIWHTCYEKWKSSPYKIKMWHDEDVDKLIKEDDEEFFKDYLSKLDPIYKWDYVRYIILEKFGGAYFDMDVEIIKDFIPLLHPKKVYIAEGEGNCLVSNHIMISPPDHYYWYNIKQKIKYRLINQFEKSKQSCYWTIETVGPVGLSYILADNRYKYTPLSKWHFGSKNTNLQLCIHHTTHQWTDGKTSPFEIFNNM